MLLPRVGDTLLFDIGLYDFNVGRVEKIEPENGELVLSIRQSNGRLRKRNYYYDLKHNSIKVIRSPFKRS